MTDPYSDNAERSVLGAILLDSKALDSVIITLKPEHFFDYKHKQIYKGILSLVGDGVVPDTVTLTGWLKRNEELDDPEYLSGLIADVLTTENVKAHVDIIIEESHKRNIIEATQETIEKDSTAKEMSDTLQGKLITINNEMTYNEQNDQNTKDEIYERISTEAKIKTGIPRLDRATKGIERSLWYIGGDSGHLKTTLALNIGKNVAEQGEPVCIFSGESDRPYIIEKLAIMDSGINLRYGIVPVERRDEYMQSVDKILSLPIYIAEDMTLTHITQEISKQQHKLYIIDYLQIVDDGQELRGEEKVSYLTHQLARLRREYDVCIISIASLNRSNRGDDKTPKLHNLKGSGDLEYDADCVMFCFYEYQTVIWDDDKREALKEKGEDRLLRVAIQKNRKYDDKPFIKLHFGHDMVLTEIKDEEIIKGDESPF